jgi:hypothetical protein
MAARSRCLAEFALWSVGATNLGQIAALKGRGLDPAVVAIVMTVIGFGFRSPSFHFIWAAGRLRRRADKRSVHCLRLRLRASFCESDDDRLPVRKAGRVHHTRRVKAGDCHRGSVSMVLGNFVAIVQSSVRRLIAYSAIAHAGYMLLAVLSHDKEAVAALLYYAVTYGLTTIGAFGVVAVVEDRAGDDKLSSFAGLSRRSPVISFCMMIFAFTGGHPPLAGFFGNSMSRRGTEDRRRTRLIVAVICHRDECGVVYYYRCEAHLCRGGTDGLRALVTQIALMVSRLVVLFGCFSGWLVAIFKTPWPRRDLTCTRQTSALPTGANADA